MQSEWMFHASMVALVIVLALFAAGFVVPWLVQRDRQPSGLVVTTTSVSPVPPTERQ